MGDMELSVAFARIGELAAALGVRNIRELPGCWEHQVDAEWRIAVNGHADGEIEIMATSEIMRAMVPSFGAAVWYNGWLAGLILPYMGVLAAGEMANEDTFIAPLERAIEREGAE